MSDRSKRILGLIQNSPLKPPKKRKLQQSYFQNEDYTDASSPLPEGFETELIQLQNLLGDIFEDKEANKPVHQQYKDSKTQHSCTKEAVLVPEDLPESLSCEVNNDEELTKSQKNFINLSTPSTSQVLNHDNILRENTRLHNMTTPPPHHEDPCQKSLCPLCNDQVLTSEELDLNIPTPSTVHTISTNVTPSTHNSTRKKTYKTDRGKKRLVHKENWEVVLRKKMKNEGKSFINQKGKEIARKSLGQPCSLTCRYKCVTAFPTHQRQHIFDKFWAIGDRKNQWEFVIKYTDKIPKRRLTTEITKHDRQNTFIYYLPTTEKERKRVCKIMFLNTIACGERIITTAWKKYDGETMIEEDKRGRYKHKRRVKDDDMVNNVSAHVNSLDRVESHYIRKDSKKLYLNNINSSSRMFELYNEWFDPEIYKNKANKRQYCEIVNSNFNLGFYKPKKDRCDVCHVFESTSFPSEEEKVRFLKHQAHKKAARLLKKADKAEATSNSSIVSATFDFEKVLQTPHGEVSIFYYKRKLNTFNFTVFDLASKIGTCYMWHEGTAKRGANEVASCLHDFIEQNVQKGVKEFRFWSDNCTGQNRNRIVFGMYLLASKKFNITIIHRFMEKGHTQNEGDSVHSLIERASERKLLYVPDEWFCLVRWAKSDSNPYIVKEMATEDIFDFKALLLNKNWTKDINNNKVKWTQISEIKVQNGVYDRLEYKYDLEEEPRSIVIIRSGTRKQRTDEGFELSKAYSGPLAITFEKYKDLNQMCASGVIPQKYHQFYKDFPHKNKMSSCQIQDDDSTDDSE